MMVADRDGRCDICMTKPSAALCVDHDHVTGEVRGLLCGSCNRALGLLGDNLEGVMRAVKYLRSATWDLTPLEQSVLNGRVR